jgi:hypothetical protein
LEEQLLLTHEVAAALGMSRQRVLELAKAGRLGRKVAGRIPYYLFTAAEVAAYKQSPRKPGRPKAERPMPIAAPTAPPAVADRLSTWIRRARDLSGTQPDAADKNRVSDK